MIKGQWVMTEEGLRGRFVEIAVVKEQGKKPFRIALFSIEERGLYGCPPEQLMLEEEYYVARKLIDRRTTAEVTAVGNGSP